jgi:membrane protease YdiL (CAAX protease family)
VVAPAGASRPPAPGPGDEEADPVAADPDRRRVGWVGLGAAGLFFVGGFMAANIAGATYAGARGIDPQETRELGYFMVTSLGLWVGFLVLPVLWARRRGGPAGYLGLAARWSDLPLGVAVGLGSTLVTGLVSSLLLTAGQQKVLEDKAKTLVEPGHGPLAAALLVVFLCVLTPLAEEVFFRGMLFRSLHRATRLVIALLIGSLVFGLLHYDFKPAPGRVLVVQIGMLSLFGLALCALAHRTGRLAAGIVAHAAFNAVTVFSLLAGR